MKLNVRIIIGINVRIIITLIIWVIAYFANSKDFSPVLLIQFQSAFQCRTQNGVIIRIIFVFGTPQSAF